MSIEKRDPGLSAVLSFFMTGLGQIYNGQVTKGIILIVIQGVNVFLVFLLIGIPLLFGVWVYGIYDAYNTAQKINESLEIASHQG